MLLTMYYIVHDLSMVVPTARQGRSESLEKPEGNVATPEAESGQRKVNLVEDGGEFLPRSARRNHKLRPEHAKLDACASSPIYLPWRFARPSSMTRGGVVGHGDPTTPR